MALKRQDDSPGVIRVRIHLMGGFRVEVGSHSISDTAWRLSKAKAIVKLLALNPSYRLHRDQVLEVLWPHLAPDAAANNLHQTLHAARQAFSRFVAPRRTDAFLSLRGQILNLGPLESLWVDVEAFKSALAATRASPSIEAYQQAFRLYAGDLLPEDRYEDWTGHHRDALSRSLRSLYLGLADLHEEAGRLAAAINVLEEVLRQEPADEDAHVRLMRLFVLTGQTDRGVRQYQRMQEVIPRELEAEPQASTFWRLARFAVVKNPLRTSPLVSSYCASS